MMDTDTHIGHPIRPPQITMIGAMAIIGAVWDATTYGMNPRSMSLDWEKTMANPKPSEEPNTNPNSASRNVKSASRSSTSSMIGSLGVRRVKNTPKISHACGMEVSSGRTGSGTVPSTDFPTSL